MAEIVRIIVETPPNFTVVVETPHVCMGVADMPTFCAGVAETPLDFNREKADAINDVCVVELVDI